MDTRFWGPSGWRLLHIITFSYIPHTDKESVRAMFNALPFVLPCKFCRSSLQEYMESDLLEPALESRELLTRWLWRIHNAVNAKLRSQNVAVESDPPFEKVARFYKGLLASGCSRTEFPGWDFLFSVAELHPLSKAAKVSIPMPGISCDVLSTPEEKNKGNCLKPEERMEYYRIFWNTVGRSLPFKEWRQSWARTAPTLFSRKATLRWLWKVRCRMENDLELLNKCKYSSLCKTLKNHRSGCSRSVRARTCRKNRSIK